MKKGYLKWMKMKVWEKRKKKQIVDHIALHTLTYIEREFHMENVMGFT